MAAAITDLPYTDFSSNKMMNFQPSSSGDYVPAFDIAGQVLIASLVNQGRQQIALCELYKTLGAESRAEKTSVLWAVRRAKDAKMISKTARRSVYEVCHS